MGWRERDYARLDDRERDALIGAPGLLRRGGTAGRIVGGGALLAIAISAGALVVSDKIHLSTHVGRPGRTVTLPPVSPPPNVLRVHWRVSELSPAAGAGRLCIDPPSHARVCASYVVGEKPADALTRALNTAGIRVESSG